MVSIRGADWRPHTAQGNNLYGRGMIHKPTGRHFRATTTSGAAPLVEVYYDDFKKGSERVWFDNRKTRFALWLALHREGIHLGERKGQ